MKPETMQNWKRDAAPEVIVPKWRFTVLFGPEYVKGDINETYLCQRLIEAKGILNVTKWVLHEGRRYVYCGGCDEAASMYELAELTPGLVPPKRQQYCYSGTIVTVQGRRCVLCRPLTFRAAVPAVEEMRWEQRQMFAHGGNFALQHRNYESYIRHELDEHQPGTTYGNLHARRAPVIVAACREELKVIGTLPKGHDAMKKLCLTDPLFVARPWAKSAPVKARAAKVKLAVPRTADELLEEMLEGMDGKGMGGKGMKAISSSIPLPPIPLP